MSENLPHRPPAAAPMQSAPWEGELPTRLLAEFPESTLACRSYLGQNFVELLPATVPDLVAYLKRDEHFDTLTDLTAVDHPIEPLRFEVVYILYSFQRNERIRLKTRVGLDTPVPSITSLFKGADWLEREVFDMFGIPFAGHPNLKRILMPDEWTGHPLRKDYSILGMDNHWVRENLNIESGQ